MKVNERQFADAFDYSLTTYRRDVATAVGGLTRPGEKGRAGRGPPAVGGQAFDRGPLEQSDNVVNQVLSFASSASPGISIGDSGAS